MVLDEKQKQIEAKIKGRGEPASWYSFDKDYQKKYNNKIAEYEAKFVKEFQSK